MDKETIDRVIELAKPEFHEIDGLRYSARGLSLVHKPSPDILEVSTLSGLVDFLKNGEAIKGKLIVHVKNPTCVRVYTSRDQAGFISTSCQADYNCQGYSFDRYHDMEETIIRLQANFIWDNNLKEIIELLSSVTAAKGSVIEDDGVSQALSVKIGVALKGDAKIKNPVTLTPIRTFPEVNQVECQFIARVSTDGDKFALFEAGCDAWKLKAMQNIKAWLEYELGNKYTVIA